MTAQILSMHPGHHASELAKIHTQFGDKMDTTVGAHEPPTPASPDSADTRGRRRDRSDEGDTGDGADADGQGSSRKRRRSRKGLDKKFECPHEGCGKSYSRAEHLYRHQLNRECIHSPARCDYTGRLDFTTKPIPPLIFSRGKLANSL